MSSTDRNERRVHINFKPNKSIDNTSNLFFIGSCFGEEIHKKMIENGHSNSISNPFGTIFHPIPLLENLERIVLNKTCTAEEIYTQINTESSSYHHLQLAHKFHDTNKTSLIDHINQVTEAAHKELHLSNHLFITLGTAWHYKHLPTHQIVGNCHKLPQAQFQKSLSNQAEIKQAIQSMLNLIKTHLPKIQLTFTISPVKHLRDGLAQNLASKSTLISAMQECLAENSTVESIGYFPSYEFVTEELNDWSFFREDKMHPTAETIDLVFEKFTQVYRS
jgi:paraquat-inducible protein B